MIRIVLVDDEHLVRGALAMLLDLEADITVAGQAATARAGADLIRAERPDVALLDLQLPDGDGISLATRVLQDVPETAVIIVTGHGRPGHLRRALAAGVRGFLPKTASAESLVQALRTVHGGGRWVDPQLAAEAIGAGDSPLTPREADVLELAAGGAPVEEIAARAHLSPGTVRNYLSAAAAKLQVANRHQAVERARRLGWI